MYLQNGKILHVSKSMCRYRDTVMYSVKCTLQFHTCDICHVRISHYYYKNPTFPGPCSGICTVPTCGKILPCISHGSQGSLARNTVDCMTVFSHNQISFMYLDNLTIGYEQYRASHETVNLHKKCICRDTDPMEHWDIHKTCLMGHSIYFSPRFVKVHRRV